MSFHHRVPRARHMIGSESGIRRSVKRVVILPCLSYRRQPERAASVQLDHLHEVIIAAVAKNGPASRRVSILNVPLRRDS